MRPKKGIPAHRVLVVYNIPNINVLWNLAVLLTGSFCNCCAIPCLTLLWEPHAWLPLLSLLLHPNLHINFIDLKCLFYTGWKLYLFWIFLSASPTICCEDSLREKRAYLKSFWSVFSCIWTEYGELNHASPRSIWMQENTG